MTTIHRLTLSELRLLPEYQCLTPKQQLFLATYCEGGLVDGKYDSVAATMTAYQCKTPEIARIMSYAIMGNIRIIAVLNRHFNVTPTEEFMRTLDRAIRNKNLTIAQMEALKLKSVLLGYPTKVPTPLLVSPVPPEIAETEKISRKSKRKHRKKKEPIGMEKEMENVRF